jgi:superfamily II DNA/RNA helicase
MIKQALQKLNIEKLNPMQEAAIDAAKKGDVILLSPTGSGKTLGFLLPLLGFAGCECSLHVQVLILVPSRELALQIEQVFPVDRQRL